MPAPTFIAAHNTSYTSTATTQTVSVTTLPGDTLVVYGGGDTDGTNALILNTPTGNSVSLTLLRSVALSNWASAFIWSGTDLTGGTNWTLSCTAPSVNSPTWGFTCVVFRGTGGTGSSNKANGNGAPSVNIVTTQSNSALVVFNNDFGAVDGTTRTWRTINSITPTAGNGLELTYVFNTGVDTLYGAYYNDAGAKGLVAAGLTLPAGQTYSIVVAEVMGTLVATTAWLV
jgi:hypothetical protein